MNKLRPITEWLPMSLKEANKRGWEEFDIILISGDAYVDHPAFGTAVIGRIIEDEEINKLQRKLTKKIIIFNRRTIYVISKSLESQGSFSESLLDAWTPW